MASTVVCQKPSVDYFSSASQKSRNIPLNSSSFVWDSSPYDITVPSPDSCDSIVPSPVSPTLGYPAYTLPKTEEGKDQVFNFGSFDDWMGWDDPADNALSPTSDFFPELKMEPVSPNLNSRSVNPSSIQKISEDSAVFNNDNMSEEPLFQSANGLPKEELYSTPLSWARPSSGIRRSFSRLSPEEEEQLRSIAMPQISKTSRSQSMNYPGSPSSASEADLHDNSRKRKSSVDDDEDDDDDDHQTSSSGGRRAPKKTAHNMIEKRYRTNLNDKITALRDSVPSLRIISRKNSRGEEVKEDLQGLTPAHKLNKATVLSKATEYIAHLEKRNKSLIKENSALKSRVEAFEILMLARQSPNQKTNQMNMNGNIRSSNNIRQSSMNGSMNGGMRPLQSARQNSQRSFGIDSLMS